MLDMTAHRDTGPEALHALTNAQSARLEAVRARLDALNAAIREAVDAGLSVELARAERHHCGSGCWGDLMRPVIVKCQ